jgi:hypothetical protein
MKDALKNAREIDGLWGVRCNGILLFDSEIDNTTFRLYLQLKWYEREKGSCFPGIERMMADTKLTRRSVFRCLAKLENKGLIKQEKKYGKSNITILMPLDRVYEDGNGVLTNDTLNRTGFIRVPNEDLGISNITRNNICDKKEKMDKSDCDIDKDQINAVLKRTQEKKRKEAQERRGQELELSIIKSSKNNEKESDCSLKDIELIWHSLWQEKFDDLPDKKWRAKRKAMAKILIDDYGSENTKKLVEFVFEKWNSLRERFKLDKSYAPTLQLVIKMGDMWIQEAIRGEINSKGTIRRSDKHASNRDPEVGWRKDLPW